MSRRWQLLEADGELSCPGMLALVIRFGGITCTPKITSSKSFLWWIRIFVSECWPKTIKHCIQLLPFMLSYASQDFAGKKNCQFSVSQKRVNIFAGIICFPFWTIIGLPWRVLLKRIKLSRLLLLWGQGHNGPLQSKWTIFTETK